MEKNRDLVVAVVVDDDDDNDVDDDEVLSLASLAASADESSLPGFQAISLVTGD